MNVTQIFNSLAEFLAREDKTINGVTTDFVKSSPNYEEDNKTNQGCFNCSKCRNCVDCLDCYSLNDCTDCTTCSACDNCNNCRYCMFCKNCTGCDSCSGQEFAIDKSYLRN